LWLNLACEPSDWLENTVISQNIMSDWLKSVDIYCERTDPTWWAEPINALTNLAFVIAGLALLGRKDQIAIRLGIMIVLIGAASFLFHTFANRLTGLLDVLFIGLFLVTYAWVWAREVARWPLYAEALSVLALILLIILATTLTEPLRAHYAWLPSGMYVGAWLYLVALGVIHQSKAWPGETWLWSAVILFVVSLTARQLDQPWCEHTGGTHWLWHILNACVLYGSVRALSQAAERQT
jgi:hypothetical protein